MVPRLLHYSDLENAYDDPERVGRLAGLVRSLREDDALVCGTGDNTSPGVLALVTRGEQALDFFGVTDPRTASINPYAADLTFTDPVAVAREATAALRERGAEGIDPEIEGRIVRAGA